MKKDNKFQYIAEVVLGGFLLFVAMLIVYFFVYFFGLAMLDVLG